MTKKERFLREAVEYSGKSHAFANKGKDNASLSYLAAAINSLALYLIEKEEL